MIDLQALRDTLAEKVMGWEMKSAVAPHPGLLGYWVGKGGLGMRYEEWRPDEDWGQMGRVLEVMTKRPSEYPGRGWWWVLTSPFMPGEPWRAGLTPKGIKGWNDRAAINKSADTLPLAVCLAAEAAVKGEVDG